MSLYHNMQFGLSGLLYQYQNDIATIVSCLSFNTKCLKSFKYRVGYTLKVAFLLALNILLTNSSTMTVTKNYFNVRFLKFNIHLFRMSNIEYMYQTQSTFKCRILNIKLKATINFLNLESRLDSICMRRT